MVRARWWLVDAEVHQCMSDQKNAPRRRWNFPSEKKPSPLLKRGFCPVITNFLGPVLLFFRTFLLPSPATGGHASVSVRRPPLGITRTFKGRNKRTKKGRNKWKTPLMFLFVCVAKWNFALRCGAEEKEICCVFRRQQLFSLETIGYSGPQNCSGRRV